MSEALTVRFRVDFDARCSVGIGKIELLEAIAGTGSLSQAARRLKMSYRRAWLLMADLNASFDQPVVDTDHRRRPRRRRCAHPLGGRLVVPRIENSNPTSDRSPTVA